MIGFLKGTLAAKRPPRIMLDVAGVGYEIEAPMSTFYELPAVGAPLTLVTHLLVREDAHVLYGFSSERERVLFRSLLKVTGIGARIALAILSGMSVDGFYRCISNKDLVSLTKVPGVGRKTAERLLVEMADRLPVGEVVELHGARGRADAKDEARDALIALGYKPAEVVRMLDKVDTGGLSTEDMIREALKRAHAG